jgi:hypothetical protein
MNTFLVVMTMVAGVIQPERMEIRSQTHDCMPEIQVVQAINRVNQAAGRDIQYLVQCERG